MRQAQSVSNTRSLSPTGCRGAAKHVIRGALVLGLLCGGWAGALAQQAARPAAAQAQAVAVELTQHKVVKNDKGEERLADAAAVKPGDDIEDRVTDANQAGKAGSNLVGNLPIPEGLEYLPRSAKPGAARVKAAASDGVFAAEPLLRTLPGGKSEPLPYNEYRALRWTLGQLPAGGATTVSARVKVEAVAAPAAAAKP